MHLSLEPTQEWNSEEDGPWVAPQIDNPAYKGACLWHDFPILRVQCSIFSIAFEFCGFLLLFSLIVVARWHPRKVNDPTPELSDFEGLGIQDMETLMSCLTL